MNGSLAERGFRLVRTRANVWVWRHPHDVQADDLDGTDMSDAEFEADVIANPLPRSELEQIGSVGTAKP